jgi:hypothetical protein
MNLLFSRPNKRATPFGIFHNLDCAEEETGFISIHIFTARLSILWAR